MDDDGIGLGGSFRKPEVLPEYCLFYKNHVIDFSSDLEKKNLKLLESTSELKTHRRSIEVEQERELILTWKRFSCAWRIVNCPLGSTKHRNRD